MVYIFFVDDVVMIREKIIKNDKLKLWKRAFKLNGLKLDGI